jgi:hypothetical protein
LCWIKWAFSAALAFGSAALQLTLPSLPSSPRQADTAAKEKRMARTFRPWALASLPALMALAAAAFMAGCATTSTPVPALKIYDGQGNKIAKSTEFFEASRVYPFGYQDVFDAATKTLFRKGFQIDLENRAAGVVLASGVIPRSLGGPPLPIPFTAAVRIRQLSKDPRTELQFTLDTHWDTFYASGGIKLDPPSMKFGPEIMVDVQKVLSTFE